MATTTATAHNSKYAPGLSDHDRFLIDKSEDAIRDGIQLERWCREGSTRRTFVLNPGQFKLKNRAEGYFGTISMNGATRTVMGCRQYIDFGHCDHPNAAELLKEFVLGHFLTLSHWTNPDGHAGGFDFTRSVYRTVNGEYGEFAENDRQGAIDWRDLDTKYRWALLTVMINDFSLKLGPMKYYLNEAACVVPLPEFMHVVENPSPENLLEVSIGYPFIDYAPIPNIFGYGPGKFGIAVKLYSFFLTKDKEIKVMMEFASAPRAKKVFDLAGLDPVYGAADMMQTMTLGLLDSRWIHDMMDTTMLTEHCSVHQLLMDGAADVWEKWVAEQKS
ncbi:MAG: hypothetical protein ABL967_10180 [Bryobacteraceae bacterium]